MNASDEVSRKALDAARFVLQNREFRKNLILGMSTPVSYPEQLKNKFSLSPVELAEICTFAFRLNQDENAKLAKKTGINIAFVKTTPDFWAALRGGDAKGELADKIQKKLGLTLEK